MGRTTFLALGGSISLAFVAGDAFELVRTGKPNATLGGLGLIAAFPLALWGADFVAQDKGDRASWAITIAASGMVAYGLWPVVDRYVLGHEEDEAGAPKAHAFRAAPTVIVGPHETTGAGIGFTGRF